MTFPGWDDIQNLSISPDGKRIALVVVRNAVPTRPAVAALQVYNLVGLTKTIDVTLAGYDPAALINPGKILFSQLGQLTLAVPNGPLARYKAVLMRYDPADKALHSLAFVEDTLYGWGLNQQWFIFATESGLWGIRDSDGYNDNAALQLLDQTRVNWVDW